MRKTTLGARTLIIQNSKILLVKHSYIDGWYCVGGGIDSGESPLEAATRELYEEVGITPTAPLNLMGAYYNNKEDRDDYVILYTCNGFTQIEITSPEIAEAKWFAFDSLPEDISPATLRRVEEYLGKKEVSDQW